MGLLDRLKPSNLEEKRKKLHHLEEMDKERRIRLEQKISSDPSFIEVNQQIEQNNTAILKLMTANEILQKSRAVTTEVICGEFERNNPFTEEMKMIQALKAEIAKAEMEQFKPTKRIGKWGYGNNITRQKMYDDMYNELLRMSDESESLKQQIIK